MAATGVEGKAGMVPEYEAVPQREPVSGRPSGYDRQQAGSRSCGTGSGGVQGTFDFSEQMCGSSEQRVKPPYGPTTQTECHRFIMETMAGGALVLSPTGAILYCNQGFSRMMSLPAERLTGSPFLALVHPDYRESFKDMLGRCRADAPVQEEIVIRPGNESNPARYLSGNARKMDDKDGACVVVTDIVVRVGAENAPKQARTGLSSRRGQTKDTGAVGALTGGFIHDFNNVLSAIIGFSEMSLEEIPEGHPAKSHAAQILKAAVRGRDLVRQIVPFGHGTEGIFSLGPSRLGMTDMKEGKPPSFPVRGGERILLVDDEDAIIEMGKSMLRRLGYQVDAVSDGVQALKMFRGEPNAFDLIITDHTMPRMTGTELARELMGVRPGVPVILCTGYSEAVNRETAKDLGIRELIMKPISRNDLADTIRRVLDGTKT